MTKAQEVYERVEQLVREGVSKADAFKQLAEQYGQPVDSMRGSYYTHKRTIEGGGKPGSNRRTRRRETTTDDAVEAAIAVLERSKDSIDAEVEAAEQRAREAHAEHEALKESAPQRKAAIDRKIKALKQS